ncbi:MAG: hypothetical protein NUW01_01275 [Gemmatimonadaceae bacterium]|nr:hypothetical protein [Gemmatimonadaceae bacterium]
MSDEGDFICERDKAGTSNPCAPDPSYPFITPLRASQLNTDELVRLRLENHRLLHEIERLTALLEKPK